MSIDGGYYAIKGFIYQYDATILKIMNVPSEDDLIAIECIQDFSTKDEIYQIKYKEAQNYSSSKIKKAVIQLIEEWKKNSSLKYYLIAYFKDKQPQEKIFTHDEIKGVISKESLLYSDEDLQNFCHNFVLAFTVDYNNQTQLVLKSIKKFAKDDEKTLLWYWCFFRYLTDKVASNQNLAKRICTRREILEKVNAFEQKYFDCSYKQFLGKRRYLNYIKKKVFPSRLNTPTKKRLFILELKEKDSNNKIANVLRKISDHFIKKTTNHFLGDAPYILLKNINKEKQIELKEKLYSGNFNFVDGYPFYGSNFKKDCLTQNFKNHKNDVIKVRIFNSDKELQLISENYWNEIYDFTITGIDFSSDTITKVYVDDIDEIKQIL
ncbi:hypothetical protein KAI68_04520 [bacterium]|nr:hypothetical protein [bacterium]